MMHFARIARPLTHFLLLAFVCLSAHLPAAQAGMVSTASVLQAEQASADRERVRAFLARDDVRGYLVGYGVSPDTAAARVDSLTDAEVQAIAGKLDQLPAGGDIFGDLIFAAVFVFVVLLVTDILGFTDVFPFVKKHAR